MITVTPFIKNFTLRGAGLGLLLAANVLLAQEVPKIGFVNLDRILRDAPAALAAQKKIEA